MSEREHKTVETDNADSNPNGSGPERLAGDMGISSERVQGEHDQPDRTAPDTDDESVEGLGSKASTVGTTDGQMPVDPTGHDADPSAVAGQEEENPDGVVNKHPFDPSRNPGHSHG